MQPRTRWILYPYRARKYYRQYRTTTTYSLGTTGQESDVFDKVTSLCISDGYLFVGDSADNFVQKRHKDHPDFEFITQEGETGEDNGQFRSPRGMCCEGDRIYICDRNNYRIIIRDITDLAYRDKFGTYGTGDNHFNYPSDICSDGTYLYICDTWNHRIKKHLLSDKSFVTEIGSLGSGNDQFNYPKGICYYDNHIFVVDTYNDRIHKRLASDLSYVSKIGTEGVGNDQFNTPIQICCSPTGKLYITDSVNHRIMKREASDLSYINKIGSEGSGDDQFDLPHGVSYSDGYIYIGDYNNHRFVKRDADDLSFVAKKGNYIEGAYATGTTWKTIYSLLITETVDFEGLQLTKLGTWAGAAKYRITCGGNKIYPEEYQGDVADGIYEAFNEPLICGRHRTFEVQFRSTDDADQGPDQKMELNRLTKRKMKQ